nr:metallophosphoesterase family protein [Aliiroseovarius subalbicans]
MGTLTGEVLCFGGPLSNLQALQALVGEASRRGVPSSNLICTGDVVGYGADPVACVALVRQLGCVVVAGNVERQLASGAGDCGCGFAPGSTCDRLSAGWYGHADSRVAPLARDWMEDLPDMAVFAYEGRRHAVVHGGLTDISRFLWPSSPDTDFALELAAIEAAAGPVDAVIAGHSGLAFERVVNGVHWINAGVIGLPSHDGRRQTRFATLDPDGARLHRLTYDVTGAVAAMRGAGLTQGYDTAMETGMWPSEDVLPHELRG